MKGMFSPELEKLIEFTLADGRLTDQERALLETAAKKEGVDMNQLEVYIQYRLYQRKEEEIKQAEARKYNEATGTVKRCPNCSELLEDQYRFCPKCQTPVADDSTADTSVNLGNANAICGGVNINRSKNITSCDTHYHSTTIHERSKSDAELKLDAINQLRSKAEEVIGERGRIDSIAITQLRHLASQLGIDDETFKTIIKEVRSNRSGCTSGLSSINARYLSQAQQAVQANNIESLSGLFPRLEAIAAISQDDNVQYLYYLALSLLYPTKSIEVYEQQTDENYWRTFWAIITYIKVDNWAAATRELANHQPSLFEKPEEDLNVLEALFNLVKKDKDCAQDFLNDILGETSPQIVPFLRAIEITLYEEECESPEVRFYSEQVIAKICSADEAKREAEARVKAEAEAKRKAAEEEAKRKADAEAEAKRKAEIKKIANLGEDYYYGRNGKSKDYEKAVEYYRKAAEQGDATAQFNLGYCYEEGEGVEQSAYEAVKWYRKAAEQGDATAQFNLAACYYGGIGVEQSAYEAAKWARKAAEQGLAEAQCRLGECYELGRGVEQSAHKAAKWYRKAAEQGHAQAQCNLAACYYGGEGVEQSAHEAAKWCRKAAEQGHAQAQYNLAACYYGGEGVEQSAHEAAKWARKAAEQGHAQAQYNLAACYYGGEGVEQSAHEAVKWYRKAAEQGHAQAQYNLGYCYEKGEGVEQSAYEAVKWYRKAAEQGDDKAIERLKNLKAKEAEAKVEIKGASGTEPVISVSSTGNTDGEKKTAFDVILVSAGQAKLGVVKAVKESTGLGLKEAKEIVDKAPVVVVKNVSKAEAEALKAALEEAGAEAKIRGVGGTEPVISVSSTGNTDGEKKTAFDVILVSAGQAKLGVIQTVKWEMGLGLKEAKEIVDKAPVVVVKNVSKAEAEALKAALEEAGAEVRIK